MNGSWSLSAVLILTLACSGPGPSGDGSTAVQAQAAADGLPSWPGRTPTGDTDRATGEEPVVVQNGSAPHALNVAGGQPTPDAVTVFEADQLRVAHGDRITVATDRGTLQVRSVREFSLAPVAPDMPLIERTGDDGSRQTGWGSVRGTDAGFLGELLNTGWVWGTGDGGALFAFAVIPEVVRFDDEGREIWRSLRKAPQPVEPPELVRDGSSIRPDFTEVQHGIATGPDGRLYVLSGAAGDSVRLDVLAADGAFVASGWVPRGREILVDAAGAVFIGGHRSRHRERVAFTDFDLPELGGAGRIRLADYAGRVVVVNVWASWCAPCRLEMPALDSLSAGNDRQSVAILGLSDDADPAAAIRFVNSIGGVRYPLAAGGGDLRTRFGYRGLPYTVVLDREHRVVDEISGYGGTIEPILEAIETALTPHVSVR